MIDSNRNFLEVEVDKAITYCAVPVFVAVSCYLIQVVNNDKIEIGVNATADFVGGVFGGTINETIGSSNNSIRGASVGNLNFSSNVTQLHRPSISYPVDIIRVHRPLDLNFHK